MACAHLYHRILFLGQKICQGQCLVIILKSAFFNASKRRDRTGPTNMGKISMRLVIKADSGDN